MTSHNRWLQNYAIKLARWQHPAKRHLDEICYAWPNWFKLQFSKFTSTMLTTAVQVVTDEVLYCQILVQYSRF